jgi:hypothetical protein
MNKDREANFVADKPSASTVLGPRYKMQSADVIIPLDAIF